MYIYYCHWNLRKTRFSNVYYLHVIEIHTNKWTHSYKPKISKIGNWTEPFNVKLSKGKYKNGWLNMSHQVLPGAPRGAYAVTVMPFSIQKSLNLLLLKYGEISTLETKKKNTFIGFNISGFVGAIYIDFFYL